MPRLKDDEVAVMKAVIHPAAPSLAWLSIVGRGELVDVKGSKLINHGLP